MSSYLRIWSSVIASMRRRAPVSRDYRTGYVVQWVGPKAPLSIAQQKIAVNGRVVMYSVALERLWWRNGWDLADRFGKAVCGRDERLCHTPGGSVIANLPQPRLRHSEHVEESPCSEAGRGQTLRSTQGDGECAG